MVEEYDDTFIPKEVMQGLVEKARHVLGTYEQVARFVRLTGSGAQTLAQAAASSGRSILISERGHALLQQASLDRCLDELACPVLLVR